MTVTTAATRREPILSTATSRLTPSGTPSCAFCGDTGWRLITIEPRRVTRCECRIVSSDGKVRSVLPPLLFPARLSQFAEPLLGAARRWLEQPSHGLLLTGPAGTGKTWLGAAIVRALIERGRMVTFKGAADFYLDLRSSFTDPDVTEITILNRFADVEFVVLDDIGSGSLSDHERRSTLHLLDRRMNYLRPTIVTSNLTLEQIAEKLDERIASRLSGFTRIVMAGRDLRGRS